MKKLLLLWWRHSVRNDDNITIHICKHTQYYYHVDTIVHTHGLQELLPFYISSQRWNFFWKTDSQWTAMPISKKEVCMENALGSIRTPTTGVNKNISQTKV